MAIYSDKLAVDVVQGRLYGLVANYGFEFEIALLVREVDEVPSLQVEELKVILGLNSVSLVELTYRLELYDRLAFHDEVGSDVSDVLTGVVHRDDALGLVVDEAVSEGHLKGAMVHGLAVARPEGRPDVPGDFLESLLHDF